LPAAEDGDLTRMTLEAPTIQGTGPLMQFSARVGESNACVRIKSSRLEWSLIGRQWVIQMVPMASISAVSAESGPSKSNLFVTTTLGVADFCVEPQTAEQARVLLTQLVADTQPLLQLAAGETPAADKSDETDGLINLKWVVDASVADSLDLYEIAL